MNNHYTTANHLCRNFVSFNLLKCNKKKIKDQLEEQWEISLQIYIQVSHESHKMKERHFPYFFEKATPSDYNYLIVAQINNLLSYNKNIQYLLRNLAQKEAQCKYKENLLSNKPQKNSLFVRWLLRLWSVEFTKYIKKSSIYLGEKPFLLNVQNINIHYSQNNISLSSPDLLLMKLFFYRVKKWYNHLGNFSKQNNNISQIFDRHHVQYGSSLCHDVFGWLYTKQLMNRKDICLNKKNVDFRNQGNVALLAKYSNLVKYLVKSSKSHTQKNLIQQINRYIRYQDRFLFSNYNQNKSNFLNATIGQNLASWGMYRHSNHSAKWCKKRYWYYLEDGMYFSIFS